LDGFIIYQFFMAMAITLTADHLALCRLATCQSSTWDCHDNTQINSNNLVDYLARAGAWGWIRGF
jgi:hypothetical protein